MLSLKKLPCWKHTTVRSADRQALWRNPPGAAFLVLRRNTMMYYFSLLILLFCVATVYPMTVPNDRYMRNDRNGERAMLRLLGLLALGNMIFGNRRRNDSSLEMCNIDY